MTIAIALKVGDGIVLGADSASTLTDGKSIHNVYFNAEKIFNLAKGFPIGAVTFGVGGLRGRSITSLAKDLRERLAGKDPEWFLVPGEYTMRQVAERVRHFFYGELYIPEYAAVQPPLEAGQFPSMGFFVAGYSANAQHPELWFVEINGQGQSPDPSQVSGPRLPGTAVWAGMPEALNRLIRGWSDELLEGLVKNGIARDDALKFLTTLPSTSVLTDGMPLQDAIDLVSYMIDVTAGFVRFTPGAPVVHPPADLATITLYEGFRWVRRKHYYPASLNPDPRAQHWPPPPEATRVS